MTRRKKTRSLKRIHNVKTGSISKLKRAAGADRQTGKRVSNKTKSVYEKYLEQNPDAREKQTQKPAGANAPVKPTTDTDGNEPYDRTRVRPVREKTEREKEEDLFDSFNKGKLDDFY